MSRSRGGSSLTTLSPMLSVPEVMSSSPATIRSAVVFPHPDGPTSTVNSPSSTSRSRPSTARVPPGYTLPTFENVTDAIGLSSASDPARQPADELSLCDQIEGDRRHQGDHDGGEHEV